MSLHAQTKPLSDPLAGGGVEGTTVVVEPLLGGEVQAPPAFLERSGGRLEELRSFGIGTRRARWWWLPVPAFLITHPSAGTILVDTGLHPSVTARPSAKLGRGVSWFARPRLEPGRDVPAQLRGRGIDPKSVPTVVMTHLHLDHTSGISEFPNSTFVVSAAEWEAATTDRRPMLRGYRPSHFDFLFDYRTLDYDAAGVTSYASFGRTIDLFGDGSVRLAFTPGHSAGHQSVIARLRERDLVIAGDAIYTYRQLDRAPEPPHPVDRHRWRRSLRELQRFRERYPDAVIVPGHDPEHWPTLAERYE
jgi:glyoxylase-like metal-dependent hydrolase (beta-lactamase superfamily II)